MDFNAFEEVTSDLEIRNAMFRMVPLKAPGVDGFHAKFFQLNWMWLTL